MNGKAAQLDRWLMAIRQRALTNTLGQVTCGSEGHDDMAYCSPGCLVCATDPPRCGKCGAAV